MNTITYKCRTCGSTDLLGELAIRLPLNAPVPDSFPASDCQWTDYVFCTNCDDVTKVAWERNVTVSGEELGLSGSAASIVFEWKEVQS